MYVYARVCMCTRWQNYIKHVYAGIFAKYICSLYMCMCVYVCVCVYICVYVCFNVRGGVPY